MESMSRMRRPLKYPNFFLNFKKKRGPTMLPKLKALVEMDS